METINRPRVRKVKEGLGWFAKKLAEIIKREPEWTDDNDTTKIPPFPAVESILAEVPEDVEPAAVPDNEEVFGTGKSEENRKSNDAEMCPADSRYNALGLDRAGYSKRYYRKAVDDLLDRICKAGRQMQAGNYGYAVFDTRFVADAGLKMLLRHNGLGIGRLEENIESCRNYGIVSDDMADRLHSVRKIGNFNEHCDFAANNLTFNKTYFSIMQVLEFLSEVEIQLLWPEPLPELTNTWAQHPLTIENVIEEG